MATVVGTTYLNGCNYQLAYDLLSQNIENNTSTVRLYGILNVTNNFVSWSRGTASVHTESAGIGTYYAKGSYTLITRDFTWNHDSSGNFSSYIGASLSTTFVSGSTGGVITLPSIPRQANVTGATDFTDEQNPTITFNNPGGFRINARLEFAGTNIQRDNIPNTGSYTFNLTEEERNLLRSKCTSNSMGVREVIGTCISGTTESFWSWQDKIMTIVNANPEFTDFSFKDVNDEVVAITGDDQVLVKGLSNLELLISSSNKMVAKKQAVAKNYITTIDNINVNTDYSEDDLTINVGKINASGTQRLNVRAYDSRNNSILAYKDINIYDYSKPVINATATRLNNFENQTTLSVSGTYSPLNINNVDKNTIVSLQYRYRGEYDDWSDWIELNNTIDNNSFVCKDAVLSLDNTKHFEIQIQAVDKLETSIISLDVAVGQAIFFISSNKKTCYINDDEVLTKNNSFKTNKFSTDETAIGIWVDNKTVYRKCIHISSFPNNATINVPMNIENLDYMINIYGVANKNRDGHPLNGSRIDLPNYTISCYVNSGVLIISSGADRSSYSGYIIIEYTKKDNL